MLMQSSRPLDTNEQCLTQDNIDGFALRTTAKVIGFAALSWDYIDGVIATASAHGKKVGIGFGFGVATPDEVYAAGATKFVLDSDDCSIDEGGVPLCTMPVPWDKTFQNYAFAVIDAAGAKYDLDPNVAYIRVSGFMQLMEDRLTGKAPGIPPIKTSYDRLNDLAVAAGYANLPAAWTASAQAFIDRYIKAFPHKVIVLTTAKPFPGLTDDGIFAWGYAKYPGQFGHMSAQLHATLPPHAPAGPPLSHPKGDQPIFATSDHARLYLPGPAPNPWPADPQPYNDLALNGVTSGDTWIEVYQSDARLAANQPVLTATRLLLKANVAAGH